MDPRRSFYLGSMAGSHNASRRRWGNVGGIVLAVALVLGFGLARVLGGVPDPPTSTCDDPIPWDAAASVEGETAAIAGPVAAASFQPDVGGAPTFLNLGNAHPDPDRFDVVIYEDVREGFEQPPEEAFEGEVVCVQGRVRDRDGVPQMILESSLSIVVR